MSVNEKRGSNVFERKLFVIEEMDMYLVLVVETMITCLLLIMNHSMCQLINLETLQLFERKF